VQFGNYLHMHCIKSSQTITSICLVFTPHPHTHVQVHRSFIIHASMSLKVVILGAGGLVGARLSDLFVGVQEACAGSAEPLPLARISLFDLNEPKGLSDAIRADPRVTVRQLVPRGSRSMTSLQPVIGHPP